MAKRKRIVRIVREDLSEDRRTIALLKQYGYTREQISRLMKLTPAERKMMIPII